MVELHYAELQSKLPGELNCLYYSSSVLLDWIQYAEFADGFGNGFRACRMSLPVSKNIVVLLLFWLILPVIICLSQRLSHACVSTN